MRTTCRERCSALVYSPGKAWLTDRMGSFLSAHCLADILEKTPVPLGRANTATAGVVDHPVGIVCSRSDISPGAELGRCLLGDLSIQSQRVVAHLAMLDESSCVEFLVGELSSSRVF